MKSKRIIALLRAIRGASPAHTRARINKQLRAYNKNNIATNCFAQGRNGFNGGLTIDY